MPWTRGFWLWTTSRRLPIWQITPSFNGQARIDLGIYFRTAGSDSTAGGARALSFYAPAPTTFSLTYSSSVDGRNVQTGLVIQKMNRASG